MVVWIIGLSGAGKSTLANEVLRLTKQKTPNVVLLDGDEVRKIYDNDLGHTLYDRSMNAKRISNLCKFLDAQNIHVICAILSLFPENLDWNRRHYKNYYEVFIDAPLNDLQSRDSKGLYAKFSRGEISDVAGLDLKFVPPKKPDLMIKNSSGLQELMSYAEFISKQISDPNP